VFESPRARRRSPCVSGVSLGQRAMAVVAGWISFGAEDAAK